MPLPKKNTKATYETLGRGVLFAVNSENTKAPLYKGYVGIEGFGFVEIAIFPPRDGASPKVIGSGIAKARPGKDEPVTFYVTLLESSGDYDNSPGYALCNLPNKNREQDTDPDMKISMYYTDNETVYDLKITGRAGIVDALNAQ